MSMPLQKPGRSKQDFETPTDLLAAVAKRFERLEVDLAARADNAKAPIFVTPEDDSLSVPWAKRFAGRLCWLNPEFADIDPWAEKCVEETRDGALSILLLTPASIGANWYADHVHGKAFVFALNGRIKFVGAEGPYPKDCMISVFGPQRIGLPTQGLRVWRWK